MDIIRQGRCTLVSAIQMQQVLVLSCLISAYSLSVLYLDGIRSSDNQMIASGRDLYSSTFRLNVSAFCGIGDVCRACLGRDQEIEGTLGGV